MAISTFLPQILGILFLLANSLILFVWIIDFPIDLDSSFDHMLAIGTVKNEFDKVSCIYIFDFFQSSKHEPVACESHLRDSSHQVSW